MESMKGKVVWITGGGSGIGEAVALAFAKAGAHVAVSGRREAKLAGVVTKIEALGAEGLAVACDVTSEASCAQAVERVLAWKGRIDVAFANAGFGVAGRLATPSDADLRRQFETNVFGAMNTVRAVVPALQASRGRLALTGSVAAFVVPKKNAAYSASKAAVHALGLGLAAELARDGVSVTLIHPGFVESEIGQVNNAGEFDPSRKDLRPAKLMWTAEAAARPIVRAIAQRKAVAVITGHGKFVYTLAHLLPGPVRALVAKVT